MNALNQEQEPAPAPQLQAGVDEVFVFPLSLAQQRLWVLSRLTVDSAAYNIAVGLRLRGTLIIEALAESLRAILERHEVLRASFPEEDGAPVQVIPVATPAVPISITDLSMFSPEANLSRAQELAHRFSRVPFDLEKGPLVRCSLLKLASDDHVLVLAVHHIVFDAWSRNILLRELGSYYADFASGQSPQVAPLEIQYPDFAIWQREHLTGEKLDAQVNYWKQQLADAPSHLDLPTDHARPPLQTFNGSEHFELLPSSLLDSLKSLGRQHKATFFMTLLAAFSVLLSRYSGQEDIVIGSPIAGRTRPELENLIGFFVNTLALRTKVSSALSFEQLLEQVRETALAAFAHQELPFEKLVEELKPERDLSRNPIFQVMLALQNVAQEKHTLPGLEIEAFRAGKFATAKFDLSLTAIERTDGLAMVFEYNTDLFEAPTIERMARNFRVLLEAIAEHPALSIADLPVLTAAEQAKILVEFNATAQSLDELLIHEWFERQVARTPERVAVICGNQSASYADLNRRANQLAAHLRRFGVGPETLVAIYLQRSIDMLVAVLGSLKAGGAYLPLDPSYPRERLASILEDARPAVVITESSLLGLLPPLSAQVISLDRESSKLSLEPARNPASLVKPENLAYVLFTSGSSGRPKGVAVEHRSASAFVAWARSVFSAEELAATLFATSICFDLSVFEMFVPLSVGGKLILVENVMYLPSAPATQQVTLINTVPSAMVELARAGSLPASVQVVNLAGEPLPDQLAKELYEDCGVRKVYNLYGPTEDTTYSTYTLVRKTEAVTIGRPIANTQVYILDVNRRPVPIGVGGELYLSGSGLARGYFGQPELTGERFVPNPFAPQPGARMYRTGDLARFLPDGRIEYLGRLDDQIKLRGYRIELGEIESQLSKHPDVQRAAVALRGESATNKRLLAYVVLKPGKQVSRDALREYLKERLPEYMVPQMVTIMPSLPVNANGKIDRKALPDVELPVGRQQRVRPRDAIESRLFEIWRRVLNHEQISATDNFFTLGGHSLMAVQLMAAIKTEIGKELPLAALFRGPTIEAMADLVREGREPHPDPIAMQIQAGDRGVPFFAVVAPGAPAIGYAALARAMGTDQRFYKLQSHRVVPPTSPITLDEMRGLAADYIAAMRSVQPEGPYYFGGMCAGTHIAEQMVLALEAQGEEVGLFAIFDTWVRQNVYVRWLWRTYYLRQRMRLLVRSRRAVQLQMLRRVLGRKLGRLAHPFSRPVETAWSKVFWPGSDFQNPSFRAPVALFKRPKQPYYYIKDPTLGWGGRSQAGVEIHNIDFPHRMLREPYVRELGKLLRDSLLRANFQSDDGKKEVAA